MDEIFLHHLFDKMTSYLEIINEIGTHNIIIQLLTYMYGTSENWVYTYKGQDQKSFANT